MKTKMCEAGEQADFEKFCDRVYTRLCDSGLDPEAADALLDKYGATIVKDSFTNGRNAAETAAAVNSAHNDESKKKEGFRLELVDTITVPQWLYDAYIMGNEYSGHLTMTEQEKLADFKAQYDKYHLDNHDEEAQYCGTNEFDGMGGLCYDVDVYQRSSDEARKNEDVTTVAGDLSAPVYAYIGESGSGKDRRIKLEGSTLFDKLLSLRKAGTYASIGPAEGSREWNKLDAEDQKFYKGLQAKAKKLSTYKTMGDFLSKLCSENECFLFAIRQGDDAVWVNPKATKELLDNEWHGTDRNWIEDACGVWAYHKKEFDKWKKRFGKDESAGTKFTDGNKAKGEDMDLKEFYKKFEEEAKKLLGEDLWEIAWTSGDPEQFAKELAIAEFGPEEAAEEYAEMVQTMKEQGEFGEAKCEKLSPKMQQRLKLKAWQGATMQMKGFKEAGYSFLDLYDDGKCSAIAIPVEGYETEKEALAAAKKIFDDFDKYLDVSAIFDEEGGPDGEPVWFPTYRLRKTFVGLPEDEGLAVLRELSDLLYRVMTVGEAKCEGMDGDWKVEYEDVNGNVKIETNFDTEGQAWVRYNELENRTHGVLADILWVKEPVQTHLADECGSSAASLGAVPTGGSQVKDEGKDEFLKDALYRINFDGDEEIVAKLIKDGEDFSLVALMPNGEAKAVMTADLFSVVDYCKELLDMDTEDAIIVIENA